MKAGKLCCNQGRHLLPFLTADLGRDKRKEILGNRHVGQQCVAGQERLVIVQIPSPFQREKETTRMGESQRHK